MLPLGVLGAVLMATLLVDVTLGVTLVVGYSAMSLVTFASYAADKSAANPDDSAPRNPPCICLSSSGDGPAPSSRSESFDTRRSSGRSRSHSGHVSLQTSEYSLRRWCTSLLRLANKRIDDAVS